MLLSMISSFVWGRPGNVWTCQSHVNRVKITHEPMQPSRVLYTEYENFHLVRRRIAHCRSWMAWKTRVTYSKSQFYSVDVTNGKTAKRRWLNSHLCNFLNPSSIVHFCANLHICNKFQRSYFPLSRILKQQDAFQMSEWWLRYSLFSV
jgi:hypothetical protein